MQHDRIHTEEKKNSRESRFLYIIKYSRVREYNVTYNRRFFLKKKVLEMLFSL